MYISILVAAIVSMAIGFFWYSNSGFGMKWRELAGITDANMETNKKRGMGKTMTAAFIFELLTAFVFYHLMVLLGISTVLGAWQLALWAWLGFALPLELGPVLWQGRPVKLFFLTASERLIAYLAITLVLALI